MRASDRRILIPIGTSIWILDLVFVPPDVWYIGAPVYMIGWLIFWIGVFYGFLLNSLKS